METFEVGEVAIFWRPESPNHRTECTILGPLRQVLVVNAWTGEPYEMDAYQVSRPPQIGPYGTQCQNWWAGPQHLRKKKPPGQLNDIVKWSDCPWQPAQLYKVENGHDL